MVIVKCKTYLLLKLIGFFILQTSLAFAQDNLQTKINQYAKNVQGNVGVCALVLETGQTFSLNGNKKFPMQSVYKFPIAMAVLDKVDKRNFSLEKIIKVTKSDFIPKNGHSPLRDQFPNGTNISIKKLLQYSVSESDGSASDVLLRISGGTKYADQYVHQLGIKNIAIATTEKIQVANSDVQYKNWATPASITKLFDIFYSKNILSESSRKLLLNCMISSPTGTKRLKGMLPSGTTIAHKTGTSGTIHGLTAATNDAGIIFLPNGNHLAITVFISDSRSGETQREQTIANIAKAAFDYFNIHK